MQPKIMDQILAYQCSLNDLKQERVVYGQNIPIRGINLHILIDTNSDNGWDIPVKIEFLPFVT